MQISHDLKSNLSAETLDAVGGEPCAGSGFDSEEPEPGFAGAELEGEA